MSAYKSYWDKKLTSFFPQCDPLQSWFFWAWLLFAVAAPVCVIFAASAHSVLSPPPIVPGARCARGAGAELSPAPGSGVLWLRWLVPSISAIPANTGTNLGWHSVSIFKQRWVHYKHHTSPIKPCVSTVFLSASKLQKQLVLWMFRRRRMEVYWCRNGDSIYLLTQKPLRGLCHLLAGNVLWWQQVTPVQRCPK